jgi:hypothetical protein
MRTGKSTKRGSKANMILKTITPPATQQVTKKIISITANGCEQKGICPLCDRGGYFGLPLVFVLHYRDRAIKTVCFKCGRKAALKEGIPLQPTERDIFNAIEAPDMRLIREGYMRMEAKTEEENEKNV